MMVLFCQPVVILERVMQAAVLTVTSVRRERGTAMLTISVLGIWCVAQTTAKNGTQQLEPTLTAVKVIIYLS